jgi:hypothetical protein
VDRRRFLLTSLAGALAAPLGADAQQAGKIARVGWLGGAPRGMLTISVPNFLAQLQEFQV